MKRSFVLYLVCTLIGCSQIDELTDRVTNLEDRVNKIEVLCANLNTNISAMQSIIVALQNNDYILSVTELLEGNQQVGYKITFNKSGEIIIYHGQDGKDGESGQDGSNGTDGKDGKDGADGKDGQNGTTPIIGVAIYDGY